MVRTYRAYSDEDIRQGVAQSKSMAQLLRFLGLRPTGANYDNMKKHLQRLSLSADHWTGKLWSKDQQLRDWSQYTKARHCKKHLIRSRGHVCEDCGLALWRGEDIPLEVHHRNGDRTDNAYTNLQLLCPNCHALTASWKNRKR